MTAKDKYYWYTDTHFNKVFPWTKALFINNIIQQKPKGIFLTGDISNGLTTCLNLKILATFISCPIYFVLGNHDYYFSSIEKTHHKIKQICSEHSNLFWLTQEAPISLNNDICLIGTEGWYDAKIGDPKYLKFTFDWFMTKDFRKLSSIKERTEAFQCLSNKSSQIIENKLKLALQGPHNTIYLMTHFPPWKEAGREKSLFQKYHQPYDINFKLGQTIEKLMHNQNKKLIVLAGHTHHDAWIHISSNIECKVNRATYSKTSRNEEIIYL